MFVVGPRQRNLFSKTLYIYIAKRQRLQNNTQNVYVNVFQFPVNRRDLFYLCFDGDRLKTLDDPADNVVDDLEDGGFLRVLCLDESWPDLQQHLPVTLDGQTLLTTAQNRVQGPLETKEEF